MFSGYAVNEPLKKKSWDHVREAIFAHRMFYFGHPKVIHSDNGIISNAGKTEFLSYEMQVVESAPRDAAQSKCVEKNHKFVSEQVKVFLADKTSFTFNSWPLSFQELGYKLNHNCIRMQNKTLHETTFGR